MDMPEVDMSESGLAHFFSIFHLVAENGVLGNKMTREGEGFKVFTNGKYEAYRGKKLCYVQIKFDKQKPYRDPQKELVRVRAFRTFRELFMKILKDKGYKPSFTLKDEVLTINVPFTG